MSGGRPPASSGTAPGRGRKSWLAGAVPLPIVLLTACAADAMTLSPPPVIIAHRGASGHAPEHTTAAYDLALELGAHYLEQDLQLTADGVLVALHDETLDRTARGPAGHCTGPVRDRTLAQLRECDFGSWFNESFAELADPGFAGLPILTMEEIIERYAHRAGLYIETKHPEQAPGMETALVELLQRHDLTGDRAGEYRVIVQSFSAESLRRIRELDGSLPLVQLFRRREPTLLVRLRLDRVRQYADGIGPARDRTTSGLIRAAHRRCLLVHPYTVNDTAGIARLLEAGANGIFTDFPDRVATIVADRLLDPFDAAAASRAAVGRCRQGGR